MFSVLYGADGRVYQIGPFETEEDANEAARMAQIEGEFDIRNQWVYLMDLNHRLIEYTAADLRVG